MLKEAISSVLVDRLPHDLAVALGSLTESWSAVSVPWMLGGSCALLVQEVELDRLPRDIDIYADIHAAKLLHARSPGVSIDPQQVDRSGSYVSLLSHYELEGFPVELVGGFEVLCDGALYRLEVERLLWSAGIQLDLENTSLRLMPLSHELLFNLLRNRPDRYQAIADVMKRDPQQHIGILTQLLVRNIWNKEQLGKLIELLPWPELHSLIGMSNEI
ncbi:hypothetical protein QYF52_11295 [Paenibacillus polymyxa]|uniref:hypothetical protein n=1 Tax=Paenibacillus polymyxa TaxID=1406 RepID=UPI0025B71585|nr:hypothetical protein [Paenibacillus polymyxa]MDN4078521.1 hypothetical protein [Paenibacillus polymyxa]MDN4103942.1 hypothetical protein [Paenibacillus polymyxa]MDN4113424.1 hypothetical protein [Paenibacillus polymyxa]